MIVLLDTTAPLVRLMLVDDDTRHDWIEWQADRQLAKGLLGWLEKQLAEQGKAWHDVTGIGVLSGPGSFTGMRIGITVANTLAESLAVPIVGTHGEKWSENALSRLRNEENDRVVLPLYDRDATITTPRK